MQSTTAHTSKHAKHAFHTPSAQRVAATAVRAPVKTGEGSERLWMTRVGSASFVERRVRVIAYSVRWQLPRDRPVTRPSLPRGRWRDIFLLGLIRATEGAKGFEGLPCLRKALCVASFIRMLRERSTAKSSLRI